ncbi:MAG TPA: hypothetical protein VIA18_13660 [Polyangia bacterium]|jgi:hypothetical protein|nr:hypothetical protein [Polyangia bacterium]
MTVSTTPPQAVKPEVRVEVGASAENIVVLSGLMREVDPGSWFLPLIDEVHGKLVAARVSNIVVDIRKLTYSNAAGWKCFVYWMKKMQEDERATYRMCILCEETLGWQQVGMSALRIFGGDRLLLKVYNGDKRIR